jgi:CRP-like cAMP-binding protein
MNKDLISFANKHLVRDVTKGSTVLYQGEVPRTANILIEGVVRVYSISRSGDEQVVAFHVAGEPFPSSWIFGTTTSSLFFYEAMTACKIAYVQKEPLLEFLYTNTTVLSNVLKYFTSSYSTLLMRINAMQQPRARDKLMYTLYYLAIRYGKNNGSFVHLPLTLTHQTLGSLVGLTRETTAMEMSKLKKENIITYKNQSYDINTKKLLEIIGEENFIDLGVR